MVGMSMGAGQLLEQRLNQRFKLLLAMTLDPYLKQYEVFWEKQRKHNGIIPKELLAGSYDEIKAILPKYKEQKAEFLAEVLGGVTLFTDTSQIRGILAATLDKLPFEMKDDGLHYTVALSPTYGLVYRVPTQKVRGALDIEMTTRLAIPGEELDGNVGAMLAPVSLTLPYNLERTYCPFLFTDFEVDDKTMRQNFRRITSARQIGKLLGGQDGEIKLERLVSEYLDVGNSYGEWVQEVAQKTPFKDLNGIREKYPGIDLKNYLQSQT